MRAAEIESASQAKRIVWRKRRAAKQEGLCQHGVVRAAGFVPSFAGAVAGDKAGIGSVDRADVLIAQAVPTSKIERVRSRWQCGTNPSDIALDVAFVRESVPSDLASNLSETGVTEPIGDVSVR